MKKKELKCKIIKVAKEFLNKKDYHEVVVDEIAKKAGVAKGTIFFYFKTKENFIKDTLRYAKNQNVWFKKDDRINWIDCDKLTQNQIIKKIKIIWKKLL